MDIVLQITIHTTDNNKVLHFRKTYQSQSIPAVGMKIKDDLFAVLKDIIAVTIDYAHNQCIVTLEPREETMERINNGHIEEVAALHNWIQFDHTT